MNSRQVSYLLSPRLRGDLKNLYNYLKEGCGEVGVNLCSQVISDKMRGNILKLCYGRFRLDIREKISIPFEQKVVESPSLEVLKTRTDMVFSDMV